MNAIMYLLKLHIHKVNLALYYQGAGSMSKPNHFFQDMRIWEQKLGHMSDPNDSYCTWTVPEFFPIPRNSEQGRATAPDTIAKSWEQGSVGDCQMATG